MGGFLVRTPQKRPDFLTSDDKQDDASDMLQFFEVLRNGQKIDFLAHFESFFVYILVHLMKYTPRCCQFKDFIKIYICGKIHQNSICGCEIKSFQRFLYWFSIQHLWNGPFLWFFGSLLPQILFDLAGNLTRGSLD